MTDRLTVSFSGMMLYESCPSAYERRYVTREVLPKGKPNPAMQRGLDVHSGVEDYLDGGDCTLPDPAMTFDTMMDALRNDRDVTSERKFALTEDWLLVAFDDPTAMVRGVMDAIYVLDDVVHVMEWKTGKWYDDHAKQRSLYALGGLAMYPEFDDVLVQTFYFDLARVDATELNRDYSEAHQRVWQRRADAPQPPQEYKQTPNWKCTGKKKWCDYHINKGGKCNGKAT